MDGFLCPADITVVILNYNGQTDTVACLRALYAMADIPGRIIVVDNGSTAASLEVIENAWDVLPSEDGRGKMSILALGENGGYAVGNNAGIRLALREPPCRAVWILNNDTEPEPGALQALCDRLNGLPKAGMAGSTLVYAHAPNQVQCAGGYTFNRCLGTAAPLYGEASVDAVTVLQPESVEKQLGYICGASMLVRRDVLEHAGFLPEEYFLYYEDVDFGLCVRHAGYAFAWAPRSIVKHKEGGSTGASSGRAHQRSEWVDYLSLRNRAWIMRKHFPLSIPVLCLSFLGVAFNRLRRKQQQRIPLVFRALLDGIRGRMGKPDLLPAKAV